MKIEGSHEIPAPRQKVWDALQDPAVLSQAMVGCERLEATGKGEYRAVMKIGVAAVKGTFEGTVKLSDLDPPNRYRMAVEGSGGPGFVRGEALLELEDVPDGTRIRYSADLQIGGLIASVGQRMLSPVSRMMLDQFFSRMTELIARA